jgi:hypothetical protein
MSNGLNRKRKDNVVDIKAEYERIQKDEEDKRLAAEKQIGDILTKGSYQYLITTNIMGAEVPLSQIVNPSLPMSLRLIPKPKE